ncbi:MAG: tetratricopeptide repeat protein [Pseudomonadota bacterium]
MSVFNELRRRNVFRAGAAYVVVAWLIVQVVETIFPAFGFDDAALRITTIVLAIGLIPALIISWAFELTPEGLKRESEVDRTQSITPETGKKLDRLIIVVLALAVGYFAVDKFVLSESRESTIAAEARQEGRALALVESYGDKSIAVLAFDDMSQAGDQEYLSDGLAEELLNLLANVPELRVISRSSAFSFKGKDLPLTEIAEQLDVTHILEGSVRKAGNRVRITAQLIEARSDTHLWSETYDRELDDVFAVQDDIATTVVEQLKVKLLGTTLSVQKIDPEAYTLFLRARHLSNLGSAEAVESANALYQRAIVIEPNYTAARNDLAVNLLNQTIIGALPAERGIALIHEQVDRVLEVDPSNARAHVTLSVVTRRWGNDSSQAARYLERALALEPTNLKIIGNAAIQLALLNRSDEAIALLEFYTARDPVNPVGYANLGTAYSAIRRWDEAVSAYRTALQLSPDILSIRSYLALALMYRGNPNEALVEVTKEPFEAMRLAASAMVQHELGNQEASDTALAALIEKYEKQDPVYIARALAYRNENDRAFEFLDASVRIRQSSIDFITVIPELANLHDDPRWLPFLESVGKSPNQLAAIEFEVTLPTE